LSAREITYKLAGVVRHQGMPVAGVTVGLISEPGGRETESKRLGEQVTGPDGRFFFAVPPGCYALEVIPAGSTRFLREHISGIVLHNNTNWSVSLSTGALLSGSVRTVDGARVAGARVTAAGIEPATYTSWAATDKTGRYTLVLPRGRYHLQPSWDAAAETEAATSMPPILTSFVQIVNVAGDTQEDLILPPLNEFTGKIIDGNGKGVAGAAVVMAGVADGPQVPLPERANRVELRSDAGGQFCCRVSPGLYDIRISPPPDSLLAELSLASVTLGDEPEKSFTLSEGMRLRGKVAFDGQPQASCSVRVLSRDGKLDYSARTDWAGRFSFSLPAGNYEVTVYPDAQADGGRSAPARAPWRRSVVVGGDTRVDVDLSAGVLVAGFVRDQKGEARAGVEVLVFPHRGEQAGTESEVSALVAAATDDAGAYNFMLSPGTYRIMVGADPATSQAVEVGKEPVHHDVVWEGGYSVHFEVIDEQARPVSRCRVSWAPYGKEAPGDGGAAGATTGQALTDDDGSCELILPQGVYSFHVEPPAGGLHEGRSIRQLLIAGDTLRKVKLPLKKPSDASQLTFDFTPD